MLYTHRPRPVSSIYFFKNVPTKLPSMARLDYPGLWNDEDGSSLVALSNMLCLYCVRKIEKT